MPITVESAVQEAIKEALERDREIEPCGYHKRLVDSFVIHKDKVLFWYNTKDRSTRVIVKELN